MIEEPLMLLSAEDCQELQYAKTIARERRWDTVTPARLFALSVEARGIGKILQRMSDNEMDDPSFGVRIRREWVMKARRFVRLGNHLRRRANALVVATNITDEQRSEFELTFVSDQAFVSRILAALGVK